MIQIIINWFTGYLFDKIASKLLKLLNPLIANFTKRLKINTVSRRKRERRTEIRRTQVRRTYLGTSPLGIERRKLRVRRRISDRRISCDRRVADLLVQ